MNLYTKNKIYLVFAGIGGLFFLLALLLLNQSLTIKQFNDRIETKWISRVVLVNAMEIATKTYRSNIPLHVMSTDATEKSKYEQVMQQAVDDIAALQAKYEPTIFTAKGRTLYQELSKNLDNYLAASKQVIVFSQSNEKEKATIQFRANTLLFNKLNQSLQDLAGFNIAGNKEDVQNSQKTFSQSKTIIIVSCVLTLLTLFFLGLILVRAPIKATDQLTIASTKRKISVCFLIIGIFCGLFYAMFYQQLLKIDSQINDVNTNWVPSIIATNAINAKSTEYRITETKHVLFSNPEEIAQQEQSLKTLTEDIDKTSKKYSLLISSDYERALYQEFLASYGSYMTGSQKVLDFSRMKNKENAVVQLKYSGVLFADFSSLLRDLVVLNQRGGINACHEVNTNLESLKIITLGAGIFVLLLLTITAQLVQSWILDEPLDNDATKNSFTLLTIKTKLRMAFLGMVATFILFSLLINGLMQSVNEQTTELDKNWIPSIILVNAINTMTSDYRIAESQHIMMTNSADMLEWDKTLKRLTDKISKTRVQYESLISSDEERRIYEDFFHKYEEYMRGSEKMLTLSRSNENIAASKELQKNRIMYDAFSDDLAKLVDINSIGGTESAQLSKHIFEQSQQIILAVALAVFMTAILFMIIFDKNISVALQRLTLVVRHLAEGVMVDCKDSFQNRRDEIGQMANAVSVVTQTLQALTNDSVELIEAAQAGVLSARADAKRHQGEFGKIVSGMNSLLDVLSKPLLEVAQIMQNLALGELSGRMQGDYQGELRILKANVNQSLDALVSLLNELSQTMQYMAKADLTHSLVSNYQGEFSVLKANTNQTIVQMIEILKEITSSTTQAAAAITQTSEASKYVAKEASLQMLAVENVSKTIAETAVSVNEISEKSTQSSQLACSTASFVNEGQTLLNKLIDLIQHIDAEYGRIEKITDEITRIADKTHLLSLNAGLEAMRAGDHGLGFGFVAQQIGLLAEEVSVSASNIGEVISSSGQKIRLGVHATQETQAAMEQISDAANSSEKNIQGISAAIAQQSAAVKLLTERIDEIRLSSEATASAAEEISATMAHLTLTVKGTAEQARRFKLTEY